jgi:hypothetical protein
MMAKAPLEGSTETSQKRSRENEWIDFWTEGTIVAYGWMCTRLDLEVETTLLLMPDHMQM